jgi:hypothetical protein
MAGDLYGRIKDLEVANDDMIMRIGELERVIQASNGARILLNGDLHVNTTTTLDG